MKKFHLYLLSILSGLIFSLAWPVNGFAPLLFFAFVPLLILEEHFFQTRGKYSWINVFGYSFLSFLIWNSLTTWWIVNSTLWGAVMAIILNSFFVAIVFLLFHSTRKRLGSEMGYYSLIAYWITFEFIHNNWDLSWPWLTLGNGFSSWIKLIQWYEYTGVFGGSLWVIVLNVLLFKLFKQLLIYKTPFSKIKKLVFSTLIIIFLPIIISLFIFYTYHEESRPVDIVVVQPNVDPFNEKFGGISSNEQVLKFLRLAKTKLDSNVQFLAGPETAIVQDIWEGQTEQSKDVDSIKSFLKNYPYLKLVIGASTAKILKPEEITPTARCFRDTAMYFDSYNSALFFNNINDKITFYHKSKLVIGVEKLPFSTLLKPLEKLTINLGGTVGSLGTQKERSVFKTSKNDIGIAPVVCYESIYAEFVSEYVKNGAELIFIITNDGWWGDSPGYKQHLTFASLLAIENRRSIARSANTGVSCFVNQRGEISDATPYWEPSVIRKKINANKKLTFYSKLGDFIGRILWPIAAIFLLLFFLKPFISKKK